MQPINSYAFEGFDEPGKAADELAKNARLSLESMVGNRRRQAEKTLQAFASLKEIQRAMAEELALARRETAEVIAENETLKRNNIVLMQNQRRLYLGFVSLLKSIEDACGAEIAVDQRIEATLLSADIGLSLGEPADVSTTRAREFLAAAEPSRNHRTMENYHD